MTTNSINWMDEVHKRKEELITAAQGFLQIKSVLDPATARSGAPFGEGIAQALDYAVQLCADAGMEVKNVDGYAAHAQFGQGEELIGVLSHVDVVPEGDGWSTPPYAAEIVDGKIVARGALDDKGPTVAAIFAARIVKESGLALGKRVRLIFGTDEETSWRCLERYFKTEEMPTMGFSPDADFPLIYAEKGMTDLIFRQTKQAFEAQGLSRSAGIDATLLTLEAGLRVNMVPDRGQAILRPAGKTAEELADAYRRYLQNAGRTGEVTIAADQVVLTMQGVSVHGMDPGKGINAGTELIRFLGTLQLDGRASQFVSFSDTYLYRQHDGKALGIDYDDAEMGPLTLNTGVIRYDSVDGSEFRVNIRYPHSHPYASWEPKLLAHLQEAALELEVIENMPPHRVDPKHPLVTTLQRVYTQQTGEEAGIIAIGGATYARALDVGVAFGPLFPGRADSAHQRDEHIMIDDLLRATAIYAQAIYELAK
ncbi:dipeptidase PepV [Brevibacillus sp. B_LB10_24]|uniref:dipeptidase PepV n=1 Tax=Brevibacillus sp. B_LB10_24 TaxID=3380645 RepID=UPI0038BB4483